MWRAAFHTIAREMAPGMSCTKAWAACRTFGAPISGASIDLCHFSRRKHVLPPSLPFCSRTLRIFRCSLCRTVPGSASRVFTTFLRIPNNSTQVPRLILSKMSAAASTFSSSASTTSIIPEDVLQFWFKDIDPQNDVYSVVAWFEGGPDFDKEITEKFGECIKLASMGALDGWMASVRGRLALVIVLDQFSRNVYRGSPLSFARDGKALQITLETIEQGLDKELAPWERWFLYMPLMHSESVKDHEIADRVFQKLADEHSANAKLHPILLNTLEYEKKHSAVIKKFGRYPERNALLGRPSTKEEEEHLAKGPAW